jgi:thioredoxin 1
MAVISATDRDFTEQVLAHDGLVVVALRADWCESSQQLAPLVDDLSAAYDSRVRMVSLDLGEQEPRANRVCQRYGINRLPVVMLFREGRMKDLMGGLPSQEDISDAIERQLRPVLEVGEHNFKEEVLDSRVPVLVHFHSSSCEQSVELLPALDSVAQELQGRAKVVRVEADPFNARLLAEYRAFRFPMLAAFQDGEVKDRILGGLGAEQVDDRQGAVLGGVRNVIQMMDQMVM